MLKKKVYSNTLILEKDFKQPHIIPQLTRKKLSPKLRETWK